MLALLPLLLLCAFLACRFAFWRSPEFLVALRFNITSCTVLLLQLRYQRFYLLIMSAVCMLSISKVIRATELQGYTHSTILMLAIGERAQ
jgi:hypothetical protein